MTDELIEKITKEITEYHHKILDDWCKAYMAQLYQEKGSIKPGDFVVYEQMTSTGYKFWFEPKDQNMSDDFTYPYKLKIAQMAYKQVRKAIDEVESNHMKIPILCHWDGCITVDDELFHERQLDSHKEF